MQYRKDSGDDYGSFYGYYGSKEELFSALVGSQYDTIMGEDIKARTDFRQLDPSDRTSIWEIFQASAWNGWWNMSMITSTP